MSRKTARIVLKTDGSVVLTGSKQDKADAVSSKLSVLGQVSVIVANFMAEEDINFVRNEINVKYSDLSLLVNSTGIFIFKAFTEHDEAVYGMWPRRLALEKPAFIITSRPKSVSIKS